ncbi:hypothetical protein [Candidatus Poriferisodalis sp.]|uniref:hypothetical protein n=1 Tax=Candidatus Poriferisodalis sp. TaxID=3101277 RepID=UPI003B0102F7
MSRRILLLALLVFGAFACSDDGSVVTIHTEVLQEDFEAVDADDDGVVTRDALDAAERDAELAAAQEALEAERAERAAQLAEQEALARAVYEDGSAVAASFPGGQLSVAQVRASLAASPMSQMDDPQDPTHEEFISRLTSMLQLRLAAVALDELGFPVDIDASDEDINAQMQAHLEGPFEEFAQQRSVAEDPSIERLATPHCVSALVLTNEADASAAAERVRAGESVGDVAADVNLPGLTEADGSIECGRPFDLFGAGEVSLALLEIEPGEVTEPILLPSAASPTGELWVVMHLDDLQHDQADLSAIGPFAGRVLTGIMIGYEVTVTPELGTWDPSSLAVSLPYVP